MSNPNRVEAAGGRYRPDIDGLRAVAVVPVVLYHYGVAPFSGGYVGVDVFFVISGFLITSLIHAEMAQGRFSIVDFYERRVR
ncbi:MAG TPA: acyltransferase, partial [Rhizomicrobium sp.]|nr:acyltransferase [Rhizomicrobium sp.]